MSGIQTGGKGFLSGQWWVTPVTVVLGVIGLVSRLSPLTEPHGRLLRQFMTEDGYLMQTVAHNLAIGLGMSVSDGTIQTNGVQPLATFIFALCYVVAGGDKVGGIASVTVISAIIGVAAAACLYVFVKKVLKGFADARPLALLVAGFWFGSPLIVNHSMNGLETGLYLLVSIATMTIALNLVEANPGRLTTPQMLGLGVMLGLCFLSRNDAAFLIAAILLARFIALWPASAQQWRDRIVEAVVPGLISVAIALPWLIYNYRLFGSVMPISGISEALDAKPFANMILAPAKLLEFVMVALPIPDSLETRLPVVLVSIVGVAIAVAIAARMLWRRSRSTAFVFAAYGIFGVLLVAFYGGYFGAPYFMSRYLAPLSPFLALAGVMTLYWVAGLIGEDWRRPLLAAGAGLAAILVLGLNAVLYKRGLNHEHFQVVNWVQRNVPPETWVGAPQTGTLGFFHDRTINLDGKVNPDALRAKIKEGDVIAYILRSDIMYIADWVGMAKWALIEKDGFDRKFQLLVDDKAANLAVLKRVDR